MTELSWGYAQHDKSVCDVTDQAEWTLEERWAIEDALTWARLEQRPLRAAAAPAPDFLEFFERMLDANLHVPLDRCTTDVSATEVPTDDATTQEGLDAFQ